MSMIKHLRNKSFLVYDSQDQYVHIVQDSRVLLLDGVSVLALSTF